MGKFTLCFERWKKAAFTAVALTVCCAAVFLGSCQKGPGISIEADLEKVGMGRSVTVEAVYTPAAGQSAEEVVLFSYVNGRRWGSHEFPDEEGRAVFLLPLPNVGPADIQVVAVPRDTAQWYGVSDYKPYLTGKPMTGEGMRSNVVSVEVLWRDIPAHKNSGSVFVSQWEPWFAPGNMWTTAQAVPLLGFYDFTNPDVLRQHLLWFMDTDADAVLFDWSNHIWGCKHWDERGEGTNLILHATQMALETMADMRDEGLPVPQVTFLTGLSNGPPAAMEALNEELDWIYQNYIRNPRFEGLWLEYDGKPLITVLDTGVGGSKKGTTESAFRVPFFKQTLGWSEAEIDAWRAAQPPVDESRFTIRWVSSQNQLTGHDKLGYWSWMDGSLVPTVAYKDGVAECVAVSVGFFPEQGWKSPEAYGRRDGWTYLESFKTALEHRPRVIMLHQFNEFTGQAEGHGYGPDKGIYVDSYSVELSDDYEPVSLTAPGYRGDRGGWGFYYMNLTKAMTDVYNGVAPDVTVMAVAPLKTENGKVHVAWTTIGKEPAGFTLKVDGETVAENVQGGEYVLDAETLGMGSHILSVEAEGAVTRYPLSWTRMDEPRQETMPVVVEKEFEL